MTFPSGTKPVAFIYVTDRDRAVAYYRDTLGMEHRGADEYGDFFEFSGALLRMTPMPDFQAGPHPALGWDVPDITAAAQALRDKGVEFTIYEGMGQDDLGVWTAPDGNSKIAWFADPDGNLLSLSQTWSAELRG